MPPAMMAIGDSLFNGVRSLTINAQLAQWSAPAQVARALGLPFAIPDYPRNVVVNFEAWLREFPPLVGIVSDVESNINFWDAQPRSSLAGFDNIAIASTTYADMFTRTWKMADHEIANLHGSLGDDFAKIGDNLKALFFAFNTRFLLNPTGDRAAPASTSLDIVTDRKPGRLLVSIGANNGLWEMGFAATPSTGAIGDPTGVYNQSDVDDLDELLARLKKLPAEVRHIYINALPMPSAVADMMPVPDTSDGPKPGAGNFYPRYENRFGFNYGTLTGAQVSANNQTVAAINARVRAAADDRLHVVPIDQAFMSYDFKTNAAASTVTTPDRKVISNLMLEGPKLLSPSFWRGGLMGLDGMHPTIVGYAIMATEILKSIQQHEDVTPAAWPNLDQAYAADTLLQEVPNAWDTVLDLSLDIRRALAAAGELAPTGGEYEPVKELLGAAAFKYD